MHEPIKREGCYILRPSSSKDVCLGENKVALIGEAASLISPTSAEGISYAMLSGFELAKALLKDKKNFLKLYKKNTLYLQKNINYKMLKYPAMYNKSLRKIIFKLRINTIKCHQPIKPY